MSTREPVSFWLVAPSHPVAETHTDPSMAFWNWNTRGYGSGSPTSALVLCLTPLWLFSISFLPCSIFLRFFEIKMAGSVVQTSSEPEPDPSPVRGSEFSVKKLNGTRLRQHYKIVIHFLKCTFMHCEITSSLYLWWCKVIWQSWYNHKAKEWKKEWSHVHIN